MSIRKELNRAKDLDLLKIFSSARNTVDRANSAYSRGVCSRDLAKQASESAELLTVVCAIGRQRRMGGNHLQLEKSPRMRPEPKHTDRLFGRLLRRKRKIEI